jgi:hypothetical protein
VDARPTSVRLGKVCSFFGVMFLVLGLMQAEAGAWGSGSWKNGFGDAPGQAKKAADDALAGDPFGSVAAVGDGTGDCGSYCSTTDGTPSGNGGGNAGGNQPCAGCVGNADNENPSGQHHDGNDANNGFECDGNNGVALGNPAHSVCHDPVTTTTVPQTTTTVPETTTTTAPATTTTVAAVTTTTVGETTTTTAPASVLGVQFTQGQEQARGFATTGVSYFRPMMLLGALLLLVGVALMAIKVSPQARV